MSRFRRRHIRRRLNHLTPRIKRTQLRRKVVKLSRTSSGDPEATRVTLTASHSSSSITIRMAARRESTVLGIKRPPSFRCRNLMGSSVMEFRRLYPFGSSGQSRMDYGYTSNYEGKDLFKKDKVLLDRLYGP